MLLSLSELKVSSMRHATEVVHLGNAVVVVVVLAASHSSRLDVQGVGRHPMPQHVGILTALSRHVV